MPIARSVFRGRAMPPQQGPLPSWVPAVGDVASYTGGGAVLTNNWRATHDPTAIGYDPFDSKKINSAYSGSFLIPGWRTYGGILFWGGGHSATNYNGVHILSLFADTMSYECVATPFDWVAELNRGDNLSEINSYGEATGSSPLRLGGPHSYGFGDGIGATFEQPGNFVYGYVNTGQGTESAHRLDLSNPATAASARAWTRITDSQGGWLNMTAPIFSRYVSSQNRTYIMTRGGGNLKWFDRSNNTWVTGNNAGWGYDTSDTNGGDPQSGGLQGVPARNLLAGFYRSGGNAVFQYIDTTQSQPTVATATLDTSIAVPVSWQSACWCSDSNKLLVWGGTTNTLVYEITIPSPASGTWTVASYTPNAPLAPVTLGCWGKTDYHAAIKSVINPQALVDTGNDSVQVYRPRNT